MGVLDFKDTHFFKKTRMKRKLNALIKIGFILISVLFFYPALIAQDQPTASTFEYAEENQQCLKCHGQAYYNYYNDWLEKMIRERMNPYFIVDSAEYYESNHRNLFTVFNSNFNVGFFLAAFANNANPNSLDSP